MEIIKVEHIDFELVIESNNLEATFYKAKRKQSSIEEATTYSVSKGEIFIYNFENGQLQKLTESKTHPLIFENKDYSVGITFKDKANIHFPYIYSKLKEVEEKFFYKEKLGYLIGTVNFGNDLGKSNLSLRYTKDNVSKEFNFNFEVFPTKLDYRNDYDKIVADIEEEYPYLVLDFLKRTYSSFKTCDSPNTDLIWWQVFGGLYQDFIQSARFILNRPHSRIIRRDRCLKADKIIHWTPALEEEYVQFKYLPDRAYRSEYKTLTTDTPENQFLKYAISRVTRRYKKIKTLIENRFSNTISENFKNELKEIEKQLETITAHPFLRTISAFQGIRQESLVLQKATGYSVVYKSWIMLNSGFKFLDGIQKIELKNIAELYQIWCFLEMKNVLQNLLNKENPDDIDLAEIQIDDFVFQMREGKTSKVSFYKGNGEIIDLFHEFSYNQSEKVEGKSFTNKQKPDIVLRITKNDLRDNYVFTYLFDAKYRLASDENENKPDLPTEDSINQMHRYRDAIFYVNKPRNKPEKEVIGAYILFPGDGNLEEIKKQDYYKSIEDVNIGAFPLRPNDYINRKLLEDHLREIINLDTESVLKEVPPQKESVYESSNPIVLIGYVRSPEQAKCFIDSGNPFYYTGKRKPTRFGFNGLKYFAPYIQGSGVKEYFEILDYQIIPRNQIFGEGHPLYKNQSDERLKIHLGRKFLINKGEYFELDGAIGIPPYRYTYLKNIRMPVENQINVFNVSK